MTLDLSAAPELVGVPWEAAFYKQGGFFLATDASANLVRVLPGGPSAPPPPIAGPARMLIVIAKPFPDRLLNVDKERAQIAEILAAVRATPAGSAAFKVLSPLLDATRAKLGRTMTDLNPHVVHFEGSRSGHARRWRYAAATGAAFLNRAAGLGIKSVAKPQKIDDHFDLGENP